MTALIIIIAISALISFALSVFVKIYLSYENMSDNAFSLRVQILFVSFFIVPQKRKKKIKPGDFTYGKYRKLMEKELKKQKRSKIPAETGEKEETSVSDISSMLETLKLTAFDIIKRFAKGLHTDILKFKITLGGNDPSRTAIAYGIVCPAVSGVFELLDNFSRLSDKRLSKVSVDTDFISEKTTAEIKIRFKIRIFHILGILLRFFAGYLKNTQKSKGEQP